MLPCLACWRRPKKQWPSQCWLTRPGTGGPRICPPRRVRNGQPCWERFPMRKPATGDVGCSVVRGLLLLGCAVAVLPLLSCSAKPDPNTLVMVIESSPTNLDPRVGIDDKSERIDSLIFDDLLSRGNDLNVAPGLAERWDVPDPLTYIFYLHRGAKFHDGRPLTSRDVKWTFDSLLQGKIRSTKAA